MPSASRPQQVALMSAVYGYDTKKADSEGLALGAVVLPWTLTALLITDLQKKTSSGMLPDQKRIYGCQ